MDVICEQPIILTKLKIYLLRSNHINLEGLVTNYYLIRLILDYTYTTSKQQL